MDAPHKRRQLLALAPLATAQRPQLQLTPGVGEDTAAQGLRAAWTMAIAFAVIFILLPDGDR